MRTRNGGTRLGSRRARSPSTPPTGRMRSIMRTASITISGRSLSSRARMRAGSSRTGFRSGPTRLRYRQLGQPQGQPADRFHVPGQRELIQELCGHSGRASGVDRPSAIEARSRQTWDSPEVPRTIGSNASTSEGSRSPSHRQ